MQNVFKLSILSILFITWSFPSWSQTSKAKDFVAGYLSTAFNVHGDVIQPIMKWEGKEVLKYRIDGELPFFTQRSWDMFLEEVEDLTGIAFEETQSEDYQILIYVGTLHQFAAADYGYIPEKFIDKYPVWNSRENNSDYSLKVCRFVIDPAKPYSPTAGNILIKRAFFSSLGLLGSSDNEYSIFSNNYPASYRKIIRYDRRLISMHYHEAVRPGMRQYEVRNALFGLSDIEDLARQKL